MSSKTTRPGMQPVGFTGVWTPREIWLDPEMSRSEKALLTKIESLNKSPRGCFASNNYFATFLQVGPRQIKRYIARLVTLGWVEREMRGRRWRRLRVTAKFRILRDQGEAFEGRRRPSVESQKSPPIDTRENNTERSYRTQDPSYASRCELERVSTVDRASIPAELTAREQWVVWRWEKRKGKWNKPPYQPSGRPAKSNDATTWVSFETAIEAFESGDFNGVGFVLTADDPYAMADLDHCLDSASRSVKAWAAEIVDQLSSYTEITPSGEGLRVIVKALLPPGGHKRAMQGGGGVELYDQLRYMTMSGNHLAGTPETIEEREQEMAELHARLFGQEPRSARVTTPVGCARMRLTDDELLAKARLAKNRQKFCALYDHGDFSAYPSASEADLALCGLLAFWTGGDAQQIDRMFRRSALFRKEKWDVEHHANGETYGEATIAKALAGRLEFYGKGDRRPDKHDGVARSE